MSKLTVFELAALQFGFVVLVLVLAKMHITKNEIKVLKSMYVLSRFSELTAKLKAIYRFAPSPIDLQLSDNEESDSRLACQEFTVVASFSNYEPYYIISVREVGEFLFKTVALLIDTENTVVVEGLFNQQDKDEVRTELNNFILTYNTSSKELKIEKMLDFNNNK